jgi:putative ABC transport system permease protein
LVNKLVIENLKHRPLRTLLSIVAIAVEVTMMLTLVGLSRGMLDDSVRRARGVGADIWIRPPGSSALSFSSAPMPEKMVDYFEKQPHVALAYGSVSHPIGGINTVTGIDLERFNQMSGGFTYLSGGPFQYPEDVIVDDYYARENEKKVGDTIKILNRDWRISGIVEPGKMNRLVVPIKTLQDLTGNTGKLSQILIKLDDPDIVDEVIAQFKKTFPEHQIYSVEEFTSLFSINNIPALRSFIYIVIGLSVVIGFLVVFLSMYTAVLERTREIGVLKALGATPGFVMGMLMRETVILALAGSVLGILLTYGSRAIVMTIVPASLKQMIVPDWWLIAAGISLAGAMLGTLYPGLKAAKQDAIEALAYE